ncbi:MAG: LysM domain-containing protein, partial [Woeseia sp.]
MTKTPALTGRTRRLLLGLALLLLVTACATGYVRPGRDIHLVRAGETLFTIAWRYGRDHRDLAR